MIMTQTEMNNFLKQINEAFKDHFDKIERLQAQLNELEEKINATEKRPTASKSRGKRVQQAEEDA
jgi:cell division septum initiation protein DivIVA